MAVPPLAPASPRRRSLTSGAPSLAPVVSGVCKFQRHLLRIRPALGPRSWPRAPPRRPRSAAHPTTIGCWAVRGRSWARPWASMGSLLSRCSCPELPRLPALQPRAAERCTGAGEYRGGAWVRATEPTRLGAGAAGAKSV